ncbi:hypothetical protein MXB_4630, partial [Myxobolus squamalis]
FYLIQKFDVKLESCTFNAKSQVKQFINFIRNSVVSENEQILKANTIILAKISTIITKPSHILYSYVSQIFIQSAYFGNSSILLTDDFVDLLSFIKNDIFTLLFEIYDSEIGNNKIKSVIETFIFKSLESKICVKFIFKKLNFHQFLIKMFRSQNPNHDFIKEIFGILLQNFSLDQQIVTKNNELSLLQAILHYFSNNCKKTALLSTDSKERFSHFLIHHVEYLCISETNNALLVAKNLLNVSFNDGLVTSRCFLLNLLLSLNKKIDFSIFNNFWSKYGNYYFSLSHEHHQNLDHLILKIFYLFYSFFNNSAIFVDQLQQAFVFFCNIVSIHYYS